MKTQWVHLADGEATRTAWGAADPLVLARVTVLGHRAADPRAARLGFLAGLKLPLGAHGERDAYGPRPPGLEPGSGAVDFLGGATFTVGPARRVLLLGSAVYRRTTTDAAGYRLGDSLAVAALARVTYLWPVALTGGLRLGVGWADRRDGVPEEASGGIELRAQAGAAYHPRPDRFFALDLQAPLVQALHHDPLATAFTAVASVGFVF